MDKSRPKKLPVVPHIEQQMLYQGPVPPPQILEKLESVLPGAAERIFKMAEKDQDNMIVLQQKAQDSARQAAVEEHKENTLSLWMAFVVCSVFVICGTVLVVSGHDAVGATMIGTTLLGVIGSFLAQRRTNRSRKQTQQSI